MAGGISKLINGVAKKFDESKHKRGPGGKFGFQGGGAKKSGGSVASAHALFDKMKGQPKKDVLAAAAAAGINPNTAKTQLYHWQKKQAVEALGGKANPTKADLQQAAAKALGVKSASVQVGAPFKSYTDAKAHLVAKGYKKTNNAQHFEHTDGTQATVMQAGELGGFKITTSKKKAQDPKPETVVKSAPSTPVAEKPDLANLGPTKYVHALANHMKGSSKKDVVAAAVKTGVHPSTAGVQYGKWAKVQAGEPPQLKVSPEPKALQAKQPQAMSDKELDKAIDSYQGKVDYKAPQVDYSPKTYKHADEYHPSGGGKALTAKLKNGDVYAHPTQNKTFFKAHDGNVYEHVGASGPMKSLTGGGKEYVHDPVTKITYVKQGGVLQPVQTTTPIFKNDLPYDPGDHVFKDHAWANANGIQDPNFSADKNFAQLKAVHAAAGVSYNDKNPAVKSYTGSGYTEINGELRASKGEIVGAKAQQIDKLISQSSFKKDTIMWRGVGSGESTWNGAPPPGEVTDHGFTSVSFKPSTAKNFSNNKALFRVRIPAGFPGLNVAIGSPGSGVAGLHDEAEVILPRGTTYKVVERHKAKGPETSSYSYVGNKTTKSKMDIIDLEPVLPEWYIKKYGTPKAA